MLSKNQVSFVNSLKQKKFREEHQLFIAEGVKIVPELLSSSIKVKQVFATSAFLKKHTPAPDVICYELKEQELERISALSTPNEALAVCGIPERNINQAQFGDKLTLILDDIKDPGNMGTIIRIADWFGIENIVCSPASVDIFNPKVVQATMGSIARINVYYASLRSFLREQKKEHRLKIFGALLEGENIYSKQLPAEGFILIGNESKGISEELQELLTDKLFIPSFSHMKKNADGEAESLNAAIATAIICSEFRRK